MGVKPDRFLSKPGRLTGTERSRSTSSKTRKKGRPLETWIQTETGKGKCCDVCGDNKCRTLIFEENVYEDVPVKLITRGILKAAGVIFNIRIDNEDAYIIR